MYGMGNDDWFLRKWLEIRRTAADPVAVDRVDLEAMELAGPHRDFPSVDFSHKEDTPQQCNPTWMPWLGQPVFAGQFFFGVEFPASDNHVRLRMEAEDADLDGYRKVDFDYSSGQSHIKTTSGKGTATLSFRGRAGTYDLALCYLREHKGDGSIKVLLNGAELDRWQWNKANPQEYRLPLPIHRVFARAVALRPGDVIRIEGAGSDGEGAAVDYVDLMPAGSTLGRVTAGYDWGRSIGDKTYRTHSCVCGAGKSAESVRDAFLKYVAAIRVHPQRLQVQYNTWWDSGWPVNLEKFNSSVKSIGRELARRGVGPLDAYMIDHGWWTHKGGLWQADPARFPNGLRDARQLVEANGSHLGLWLSPEDTTRTAPSRSPTADTRLSTRNGKRAGKGRGRCVWRGHVTRMTSAHGCCN